MAHSDVFHLAKTLKLLRIEQVHWDWVTLLNQWISGKVARFQRFEKLDLKK